MRLKSNIGTSLSKDTHSSYTITNRDHSDDDLYSRRRLLGLSFATAMAAVFSFPKPVHANTNTTTVFGYKSRRGKGVVKFPKWRGAIDKYFAEVPQLKRSCDRSSFSACVLPDWQKFLDALEKTGTNEIGKINVVNAEMNKRKYILDSINWGISDYWASPGEFLSRNGDCEDYAITKYFSLRRLGVSADAMRIVVLQDRNLNIPHAVLAITQPKQTLILDNQISVVVSDTRIRHYRPIYAVSENFWEVFSTL